MNYIGTIIEESLANKDVLRDIKILQTRVEKVMEKHKTPWLSQWTLHRVEIEEDTAQEIADKISRDLETEPNSWYADFKNDTTHFIVFPNKVFKIHRHRKEQYGEAKDYGISLGIPPYQLDFDADEEWKKKN